MEPSAIQHATRNPSLMPRTFAAAALALLLTHPAGAARGQSIPSPLRPIERAQEAAALWGPLFLKPGSLELGPRTGNFMGGRYSIEAAGPLFIDGIAAYLPTTRAVVDPRRAADDRVIGETDVHMLMLEARMNFSLTGRRTWNRLSPHIFGGGGVALDLAGPGPLAETLLPEDVFDFGTRFAATAGAGLRFELASWLMLRAEAGLTLWKINTPSGFDDPAKRPQPAPDEEVQPIVQSEWVRGYGLTLSAGWRF